MLKTELKVEARGSPNIKAMPKTEQEMFFETIAPAGQMFFTYTNIPGDKFFRDA